MGEQTELNAVSFIFITDALSPVMAASPLIILVAHATVVALIGSLFIIVSLSVDAWEEITFDTSVLAQYAVANASNEYFATLASSESEYSTLEKSEISVDVNGTVTTTVKPYYLYNNYVGVWRICDTLSGKHCFTRIHAVNY